MLDEELQKLRELANGLHASSRQRLGGYVLFIGKGASTVKGQSAIDELHRQVLSATGLSSEELAGMSREVLIRTFDRTWSEDWTNAQKLVAWRELHEELKPTKGLLALASLLRENYFPLVLTSTIDRLVETVFISSTLQPGKPLRQWSVLVNGVDAVEVMDEAIEDLTPDAGTIFLKLCGDIRSRTFAVTEEETQKKAESIKGLLSKLARSTFIFIGFTELDDLLIPYFPEVRDKVFFIGTQRPDERSNFEKHRWGNQRPRYITHPDLTFDLIFETIAARLNVYQEYEQVRHTYFNPEDVARAEQSAPPRSPDINENPAPATDAENLVQILKTVERQSASSANSTNSTNTQNPIFQVIETALLTVKAEANRQVSFDLNGGGFNYTSPDSNEWNVNIADLNAYMQDTGYDILTYHRLQDQQGRDKWRRQTKREGTRLYRDLIQGYPDLKSKLDLAHQIIDDPQNLTFVFSGPRDYVGMPYELLQDETQTQPLVVSHPLCHKVNGVNMRHSETLEALAYRLRSKKLPLRVLMIAADTETLTVNDEIAELKALIELKARGVIDVDFKMLRAEDASLQAVRELLDHCKYHVVHYAGHGLADAATGENSGLCFWQSTLQRRKRAVLTARELASLMTGSETRLFYLSACVGAWTGDIQLLRENDYLGLMDALVAGAGVPYVLGFRWDITDGASRSFARAFYSDLFTGSLVPERAVWRARKQIYENDGTDETWASPVIVAQNPYR